MKSLLFNISIVIASSAQICAWIIALAVYIGGFVSFFTEVCIFGICIQLGVIGLFFWIVFLGLLISFTIASVVRFPIILIGSFFAMLGGSSDEYWAYVREINN